MFRVIKHVTEYDAEGKLGGFFRNDHLGKITRLALLEIGHPKIPIPLHTYNSTSAGMINKTIKRQK